MSFFKMWIVMKYLHYIFFELCDLEIADSDVCVPTVKIRHSNMLLYACDLSSLRFFDWLRQFGAKRASVMPSDIEKVSFNISRKFSIVAFYKGNKCLESCSMEYLMKQYWKKFCEDGIPDLVKYLNLNMTANQRFLCNPNLFAANELV